MRARQAGVATTHNTINYCNAWTETPMSSPAPPAETDSLRRAEDLVRRGDLAGAETALREVLARRPDHARTRHMLGLIAQRRGRRDEALRHLRAAAEAEPGNAEIRTHLGEAHRALGDAAAAVRAGREAVGLAPEWPPGLNNLGLALQAEGALDEAESIFRRLTEIAPRYPRGHYNLGNLLNQRERPEEAEGCLRRALELKPAYPQAWNALGAVTTRFKRPDEAERAYRRAIELAPGYAKARYNLGNLLADLQRFDKALQNYRRALEIDPDYREAILAKGSLLTRLDRTYGEGLQMLERAAQRFPRDYRVHQALGEAYFTRFDFAAAANAYRRALELEPELPEAKANLILCRAEVCDWTHREREIEELRSLVERRISADKPSPLSPHGAVFFPLAPVTQLAIARRRAEHVADSVLAAARELGPPAEPREASRLRIGYLSSDFRENALAHLTAGLYGLHDRERFEVIGYSLGPDDQSEYRQCIAADCDRFLDLRQATDAQVARRIRADGVHVLVDLVGFAGGARPGIPALRPAPVQVIWLYPGSMGGVFHDYMVGDPVATPPERTEEFGERLVLLPDNYQITDHHQPVPERPGDRADFGLPEDGFVFCSFNAHAKIDPEIFDLWMRLLDAVPGSVLWLLAMSRAGRQNLRHEAKFRGIDPGRLVFAPHADRRRHLERLTLADLALDTYVCNGHTTTSDALWAGVPVVSCPGGTFPSRVSASLLKAAGQESLVTTSLGEYEELALSLVADAGRRRAIREELGNARTNAPLFNTPRFVRHLEQAYRAMWQHRDEAARDPITIEHQDTGETQQ